MERYDNRNLKKKYGDLQRRLVVHTSGDEMRFNKAVYIHLAVSVVSDAFSYKLKDNRTA